MVDTRETDEDREDAKQTDDSRPRQSEMRAVKIEIENKTKTVIRGKFAQVEIKFWSSITAIRNLTNVKKENPFRSFF